MPDCAEMSVKVSGERACGPGGGGFFGKSGVEYDRPVRSGEGVGCCAKAMEPQKSTNSTTRNPALDLLLMYRCFARIHLRRLVELNELNHGFTRIEYTDLFMFCRRNTLRNV